MVKNHIWRLTAPKTWSIQRKSSPRWVTKPSPGPHQIELCLPLSLMITEYLHYAETTREARKILNNKEVLINNRVIVDRAFPVGIFDIVEFPKLKKTFTLLLDKKGKLTVKEMPSTTLKICTVIGKKILKGNKIQINLRDSRNIIVAKDEYTVGDSVIIDLKDNLIKKHLKLKEGAIIYLINGAHIGCVGKLSSIINKSNLEKAKIILEDKEGNSFETLKEYAVVVEKESII
jgi:small subunit ribosomal protein S4e